MTDTPETEEPIEHMTPIEFRARREAIGITQNAMSAHFGIAQNTINRWQSGSYHIPQGVDNDLTELETRLIDIMDDMIDTCLATAATGETPTIITYHQPEAFQAAYPELADLPPEIHRVAAARAYADLRLEGITVRILSPEDD